MLRSFISPFRIGADVQSGTPTVRSSGRHRRGCTSADGLAARVLAAFVRVIIARFHLVVETVGMEFDIADRSERSLVNELGDRCRLALGPFVNRTPFVIGADTRDIRDVATALMLARAELRMEGAVALEGQVSFLGGSAWWRKLLRGQRRVWNEGRGCHSGP